MDISIRKLFKIIYLNRKLQKTISRSVLDNSQIGLKSSNIRDLTKKLSQKYQNKVIPPFLRGSGGIDNQRIALVAMAIRKQKEPF